MEVAFHPYRWWGHGFWVSTGRDFLALSQAVRATSSVAWGGGVIGTGELLCDVRGAFPDVFCHAKVGFV